MSNPRYPEEFKIQAVNQGTKKKRPVADVAARLGVSTHSLYAGIKRYGKPQAERQQDDDLHAELRRMGDDLVCPGLIIRDQLIGAAWRFMR